MTKNLIRFDWAMKKLLRSKANFGILEGFLSELLNQNVKILNLLESESNKKDRDGKNNHVDILVKLKDGEIVLIEVQVTSQVDYFHRMLFGSSAIIAEYLDKGDRYEEIKKVYSVNILYFDIGHGKDYVYHGATEFVGIHEHDRLELNIKQQKRYKKITPSQIYPEYYLLKVNQFNDVAKNTLDEWIYFLKNEEIKDNFKAKGLLEAKNKLNAMKLSGDEKIAYEKYVKDLRDQESMFINQYEVARDEGKEEGEKIGIEKGEKVGREKREIEIAQNMKKSGMSREMILNITGIDIDKN